MNFTLNKEVTREVSYPALMIANVANKSNVIVLLKNAETGHIIYSDSPEENKGLQVGQPWRFLRDNLTPFNGEVVLSND